jgi:hypothetical protein
LAMFVVIRTIRSQRRRNNTEERFPSGLHGYAARGKGLRTALDAF